MTTISPEIDREIMGTPEEAKAALIVKTREWRELRRPRIATAREHKKINQREYQVRFELANAALHWLWHEENRNNSQIAPENK
jgi:hypothetical protein